MSDMRASAPRVSRCAGHRELGPVDRVLLVGSFLPLTPERGRTLFDQNLILQWITLVVLREERLKARGPLRLGHHPRREWVVWGGVDLEPLARRAQSDVVIAALDGDDLDARGLPALSLTVFKPTRRLERSFEAGLCLQSRAGERGLFSR